MLRSSVIGLTEMENDICYIEVWRESNDVIAYICYQHDDGKCCFYDSICFPDVFWLVMDEESVVYFGMFSLLQRWYDARGCW